ncbi:bifunctional protein-serine/threonine kinase/phosphatase [Psychromonas hadalis]|uniref:bifunctional protein-serine/threonine kinase/phosphatase n=1 Tax=Psychromonas hadalis TaxID=211669 RepID=UPI0003B5EFCA|nr:bifunctional protein-serine/threonine kinase/phosphatase [Psychromonas hadalis]
MTKKAQAQLELCIGGFSDAGTRATNQDAFAVKVPSSYSEKQYKGIVACLADGVSCSHNAQQASQTSVTQFINDYYCTPDSWSIKLSASKVLNSLNGWLYHHSKENLRHDSLITTFSCIVFKSTSAHLFHVGDSRIYRYRNGLLKQLTHDHARPLYAKKTVLTRGLGMDCNVDIDYQTVGLQQGDVFLLSSDGVHDWLASNWLSERLSTLSKEKCSCNFLEKVAQTICSDALYKGSNDNLSCLLFKVESLPNSGIEELFNHALNLIIPPALSVGNEIDGFKIDKIIHQGARSHVYLATEQNTNKQQVLKMPSLNFVDDLVYLKGFCKEQWVGQKLTQTSIMKILPSIKDSPFIYHICEPIEGITLRSWMENNTHPPLVQVCNIIKKIVFAVRILQRSAMVHRDLKPENIIISANGDITLIDFGSIQIDSIDEIITAESAELPLGALDYIAPEYLNGGQATSLSDLFSIAVINYELLCGELPYLPSTSQSLQKARSSQWQYRPIQQFRNDLPEWLNKVLEKATQPILAKRYTAMSEFISDLSPVNKNAPKNRSSLSLIERNPLRFWQSFSFVFVVIAMIELFVILLG